MTEEEEEQEEQEHENKRIRPRERALGQKTGRVWTHYFDVNKLGYLMVFSIPCLAMELCFSVMQG